MRLSGPRSRHTTSQKILYRRESNTDLWMCSKELWPLEHRGGDFFLNNIWTFSSYLTGNTLLLCYTYHSVNSSSVLTRLSGAHSRPTTSQKNWQCRESNPDLWICSQELWWLEHRRSQLGEGNCIVWILIWVQWCLHVTLGRRNHWTCPDTVNTRLMI
jgi:hypothetical protein